MTCPCLTSPQKSQTSNSKPHLAYMPQYPVLPMIYNFPRFILECHTDKLMLPLWNNYIWMNQKLVCRKCWTESSAKIKYIYIYVMFFTMEKYKIKGISSIESLECLLYQNEEMVGYTLQNTTRFLKVVEYSFTWRWTNSFLKIIFQRFLIIWRETVSVWKTFFSLSYARDI